MTRALAPEDRIRPLGRSFYDRDPRRVARELLGKVLVRRTKSQLLTALIVEVEAYLGEKDPAAHAYSGRTPRNEVLFGPPGHAYIYFIYGNHYCLNVSCEPEGKGGGVLFRALEPITGLEEMARARGVEINKRGLTMQASTMEPLTMKDCRKLTSGPGRLCQAFGITRVRDNGCDLTSSSSALWIGENGYRPRGIRLTPRIGISKAADRKLRYLLSGSPCVSGPKLAPIPARSDVR
jgi:DNA-3-methyladenine glycosylase